MKTQALATAAHYELIGSLIRTGAVCGSEELAHRLSVSVTDIEVAYHWLHENHGLVLHPDHCEPWVVHPFSLSPTHTWVESQELGWWAPCMWCGLGIIHLAGGTGSIHTRLGGEREPINFDIKQGRINPADLMVHFALPVRTAWNNVHHYCAMVLPFRSSAEIERWSTRHGLPQGKAIPIKQLSDLAYHWYGQHAVRGWKKWTRQQAEEIFRRVGLTEPFWHLEKASGTF